MPRSIYVIGHKNSDLDSVASAYAYARLLRLQGEEQAIPARNGNLKPEVRFVLERYQVEPPEALDDVYLQVRDVMRRGVISAYLDQTLLEAGLVITGDLLVSERTLAAARKKGVLVVSTGHHTFTAVRLVNLSISTEHIMNREFDFSHPEDQMSEVQHTLARRRSLPVVDNDGKLVGFLSRTDILNARPKRVILVDHNEQSQAVDGIDEAELLGIIDHHRIADVHTNRPIMFRADPVGCTGTIIAGLYHEE